MIGMVCFLSLRRICPYIRTTSPWICWIRWSLPSYPGELLIAHYFPLSKNKEMKVVNKKERKRKKKKKKRKKKKYFLHLILEIFSSSWHFCSQRWISDSQLLCMIISRCIKISIRSLIDLFTNSIIDYLSNCSCSFYYFFLPKLVFHSQDRLVTLWVTQDY